MAKRKTRKAQRSTSDAAEPTNGQPPSTDPAPICAVAGVGASAGGLEAFKRFFQGMPADCGMAFVLVPHLDPRHESVLAEILAHETSMPVEQVRKRAEIQPNHVYVMPPNAPLTIEGGVLVTGPPSTEMPRQPIDRFFRSLAADQGENAICIVLSGTGTDGTLGLMAIKEHGGLSLAETPASARYDGMPRSAIATGLVDHVLPVEEMPARLIEYVRHRELLAKHKGPDGVLEHAESHLSRILRLLRQRTGHDFGQYKKSTLIRRIQRRMQVVQSATIADYVELLRGEKKELDLLFKDILIGVTLFFRDPDAFRRLADEIIPGIFARKGTSDQVRVWVSACATGEEAYSVAILVAEQLATLRDPPRVQIFATDIDDQALDVARQARYPEGIVEQLGPARLERFFTREGHQYKVKKAVRDLIAFSRHNVTKDPPFSRIDLVCCRNLFIYLESDLQRKLTSLYHYALRPGGYLFLGSSENVVGSNGFFRTVDKKHRIFQRKPVLLGAPPFPLTEISRDSAVRSPRDASPEQPKESTFAARLQHLLVEQFAPASVVVDERGEVVYFCGHTGKYLEQSAGAPTASVVSLARKGLRLDLRAALHQAAKTKKQVSHPGVIVQTGGGAQRINLVVRPLHEMGEGAGLFLIVFQDASPGGKIARRSGPAQDSLADQLEGELRSTKEHLQTTIEELETSNEELKSSNEELLSMNEELQSANEELQTSKEELQSLNEELETVNAELGSKVEELDAVNSDLQNLLQSTQIATIFLDAELRIKKFTAAATEVFRLIDSDIGRPIGDITSRFLDSELESEARSVLRTLVARERQVRLAEGEGWYLMRIAPYRTVDQVIQGVVITFVDVTELERSRAQTAQLAAMVKAAPEAILMETFDGRVTSWNRGAERTFGWSAAEMVGRNESILIPPDLPEELGKLTARVQRGEDVVDHETVRLRKDGTRIDVALTCAPIHDAQGELALVSIVARDISDRKRGENELRRANEALRRSNEDLQHLSYAASHDLQEPLRMIANYSRLLGESARGLDERGRTFVEHIRGGAVRMNRLLLALQGYWSVDRIEHVPRAVDPNAALAGALKNLAHAIDESAAEARSDPLPTVLCQDTPLLEVFQNLLENAFKYRRDGVPPRVHVRARRDGGWIEFSVSDNGLGVPAKHREAIFQPFKRLHGEKIPGAGMGLAICARIVQHFGGRMWVESDGDGSIFRFTLPAEGSP